MNEQSETMSRVFLSYARSDDEPFVKRMYADLDKIADRESLNDQHRSIWQAMQASVCMLSDNDQHRFAELAIFDTDDTVPEAAAATLWAHTGKLDDLDTEDLLINLGERSLIQLDHKTDADGMIRCRFRLHDLLHDYAVRITVDYKALHRILIDEYRVKCPDGLHTGPNNGYFFENLCGHLAETSDWAETEGAWADFALLMRKSELNLLDTIVKDYHLISELAPAEIKNRLSIWKIFFRERMHILRLGDVNWPAHKILLQLAVEHADDSLITITRLSSFYGRAD